MYDNLAKIIIFGPFETSLNVSALALTKVVVSHANYCVLLSSHRDIVKVYLFCVNHVTMLRCIAFLIKVKIIAFKETFKIYHL